MSAAAAVRWKGPLTWPPSSLMPPVTASAFGVTIPLALTARGIAFFDNPVARGAREGAEHATRDADRVLAKLHARGASLQAGSGSTERQPPGLSPLPTG